MNDLQEHRLNDCLMLQQGEINAEFYLDGCREFKYRTWDERKWGFMLQNYLRARWWIFTRQN